MEIKDKPKRTGTDWWLFVLGFVIFFAAGWVFLPMGLYAQKEQPINFSHKVHSKGGDAGTECKDCHYFRKDGSFTGIPGIKKCKECHDEMQGKTASERKLVNFYVKQKQPIPWLVYARQPDCVHFSHAAHVENAGLECAKCHGDHGKTAKLRPYQYNRISTYSRDIWGYNLLGLGEPPNRMKMDDCAACHRGNGVRDACFVCHK